MTATVHTGAINGTGGNNVSVLYNNTTGGNVRIIWYYMYIGSQGSGQQKMFIGGDAPADGDLYSLQQNGQNMDTVKLETPQQMYLGKNMGIITNSQNSFQNASTAQYARFPIEVMLADGDKMSYWTNASWASDSTAILYNFVAIPEGN
tara:strand:- start:1189 stop:1632 length:444 start_codon:yes stop_codon:yes gene_type:complete